MEDWEPTVGREESSRSGTEVSELVRAGREGRRVRTWSHVSGKSASGKGKGKRLIRVRERDDLPLTHIFFG